MFAELSQTGFAILAVLVLLNFIFVDLSVTSSWGEVKLTDCYKVNAHNQTLTPSISLYLQPAHGFCNVANGLVVDPKTECTLWTNSQYWLAFDLDTASQGAATNAADKTMPGVYAVLIVICVISALNVVACLVPYMRPTLLSIKVAQIVTAVVQFLVFVMTIASLAAETTTPLTDYKNWQVFYRSSTVPGWVNTACGSGTYSPYIGTLWSSFAVITSFALCCLAALAERAGSMTPYLVGSGAVDSSLTDSLTKDGGPASDTIPPTMSVNNRERMSSADTFTSPIV